MEGVTKDLLAIAAMDNNKNRRAVICVLWNLFDPARSLQEAQERSCLDRHKLERIKQKRAESMRCDWMSADPETLSKFLELLAEWNHELASALLERRGSPLNRGRNYERYQE